MPSDHESSVMKCSGSKNIVADNSHQICVSKKRESNNVNIIIVRLRNNYSTVFGTNRRIKKHTKNAVLYCLFSTFNVALKK